ncbi:MAG: dephospho-CoA kinase, partial [Opitutaceae bacterium]|nr:dephospho-CoA kinase [Opitutaceae bacterium]
MIIGLTGGMGCGKSTAARLFLQFGWLVADCDQIVRHLLDSNTDVRDAIRRRHPGVLNPDASVNRPALAALVFDNDSERLWLEALLHPLVRQRWRALVNTSPNADWIVEVPLLFEGNLQKEFDFTVTVAASSATQIARLEKRGVPPALARQRISKQLPISAKIELSDHVLTNDGSRAALLAQVEHLSSQLKPRSPFL